MAGDGSLVTIRHVTLALKPTLVAHEFLALPIAERVRFVVDLSGLTQEQFAHEVGTDRETVNKWVNGKREPSPAYAKKLSEISTIPASWFRTTRSRRDAFGELHQELASMKAVLEAQVASVEALRSVFDADHDASLTRDQQIIGRLDAIEEQLRVIAGTGLVAGERR